LLIDNDKIIGIIIKDNVLTVNSWDNGITIYKSFENAEFVDYIVGIYTKEDITQLLSIID
jgi:hypothetical protein